ncbi:hypothetical protein LTR37_002384 [Vermiconidia calcicola]|uniref:Uncharacterized protein n=1 Tax=Vermiconidia calcicola TaxID=1690605 RepID=A0ACC3NTC6_9PEZI|nr:hypothetical protein LTR37_002384 [Vermiconidia calcicola]
MAEVVAPDHHTGLGRSGIAAMAISGGPRIEMVQNPDFSFPRQPQTSLSSRGETEQSSRRPASMHINLPPQDTSGAHRRSVSTLPSFTFNAANTSGLQADPESPSQSPGENVPTTPSRRGHKRGGSEFVGGDSRFGVSNAVSSSPTKANALPLPSVPAGPPPSGRRGHAHRRSAAMSSHDVSSIMQPQEVQPRLSSSLPNTPVEHPSQIPPLDRAETSPKVVEDVSDPFGPSSEDSTGRPSSRPRVGFAENVEYIPRPLSTISSGTESSMSTVRGHSYNNSINSVVSMGSPSPQRTPRNSAIIAVDDAPKPMARSSLEVSKRIEKEGEWLKSRSSSSLKRPHSDLAMAPPGTQFVLPEQPARARPAHHKKQSLSHAFGFDRRRSEPTMGMTAGEPPRLSVISLQDPLSGGTSTADYNESRLGEHLSSARRIKQWAASKMSRKSKDGGRSLTASSSASSIRPVSAGSVNVPGKVPTTETPVAETNLDAVLGSQDMTGEARLPQPRVEFDVPPPSRHGSFHTLETDVPDIMVDLDAALGPHKTPPIGSQNRRKELHSNRLTKDFSGPGGHYHRRSESAPALQPFEPVRLGTPSESSITMADVFEEDEEDDMNEAQLRRPSSIAVSARSGAEEEDSTRVEVIDSDDSYQHVSLSSGSESGLGIQRGEWEPARPSTAHGNVSSRVSSLGGDRRGSSIAEETIMEETSSGVEVIDIVEAHEEPRSSSLTKSSDSSETPTILVPTSGALALSDGTQSVVTDETYQTSTFSSPDINRRQSSFDTSRLGTSASSMTDNRTMSSCANGDHGHDHRISVDDVPSLTSSRSTMLSTMHANGSRREVGGTRTPSASSCAIGPAVTAERRRKRDSIQSLSQLVGNSFSSRPKGADEPRLQTAAPESVAPKVAKKKEHRLKKLMFWKSKQNARQLVQQELR